MKSASSEILAMNLSRLSRTGISSLSDMIFKTLSAWESIVMQKFEIMCDKTMQLIFYCCNDKCDPTPVDEAKA